MSQLMDTVINKKVKGLLNYTVDQLEAQKKEIQSNEFAYAFQSWIEAGNVHGYLQQLLVVERQRQDVELETLRKSITQLSRENSTYLKLLQDYHVPGYC